MHFLLYLFIYFYTLHPYNLFPIKHHSPHTNAKFPAQRFHRISKPGISWYLYLENYISSFDLLVCRMTSRIRWNTIHTTMSMPRIYVMFTWPIIRKLSRMNISESTQIATITCLTLSPHLSSLWWIWFLSGKNGFFLHLSRWPTTLTTSSSGTSIVVNASTML